MITVSTARAEQYSLSLELMFARHPADERMARVREVLDVCKRGEISLDGLLLAEEEGRAVGAALYILQPDKTAFIWPPVAESHETPAIVCDAIYREISRQVDAADAWLSQCLVELDEKNEREALVRNGFYHLANLSYQQRLVDEPLPNTRELGFSTITFDSEENGDRFAALLERSYIDTLDCPDLNGKRTGHEAIKSHQDSGIFNPSHWKIYQIDNQDIGVLLLNDQPEQNAWEVVYIGLVPEARGNGYSRDMLLEALHSVRAAVRGSLMLAVDSRNTFAKKVYESLGFFEIALRAVHVRSHPDHMSDK